MNTCKQAYQKAHWLRSRANQLKASLHNQGVRSLNRLTFAQSTLRSGQIIYSPGGTFAYEVIGPCCRLFDRESLPWPSCSITWRGKQPSWRRVGRRFVLDAGSKRRPTYAVRLLGQDDATAEKILTLYWVDLSASQRQWWYGKKPGSVGAPVYEVPAQLSIPDAQPSGLFAGMA